jgi:hypothetical protein
VKAAKSTELLKTVIGKKVFEIGDGCPAKGVTSSSG